MDARRFEALLHAGVTHHNAGRLEAAERLYLQARALSPRNFDVLHLLGSLRLQGNRIPEALDLLRQAVQLNPRAGECRMRLGIALAAQASWADAKQHLGEAVRHAPKLPEAWAALAFVLKALQERPAALEACRRAIALNPLFGEAHDRLGSLVAEASGLVAALPHFQRAVETSPGLATAWGNLGLALAAAHRHGEALLALDRALSLQPHLLQARVGRGLVLQQSCRADEASVEFAQARADDPRHWQAHTGRLLTLNYLPNLDRASVYQEHVLFGRCAATAAGTLAPLCRRARAEARLRVAFLSPDLRTHSISFFIEPLLQHLDKDRIDVLLYHDHHVTDGTSERLQGTAGLWRNFVGQSSEAVETLIRSDAPDVLVDLAGHTGHNRLPLFARRLAPVQISYLGYPNTTGLASMDYRFVDPVTDPGPEDDQYHSEKLIRYSPCGWSYLPPATAPQPETPAGGGLTFGSFNNLAKLSDPTLALWARVLEAVPGSRLLLKAQGLADPMVRTQFERQLQKVGLDVGRVEVLDQTPSVEAHLHLYSRVDIALDPFPYNGTTTTCEALWMGVPVIALLGDRHASRVGASLLSAIKHLEWVAESADDYVRIARRLAADRSGLAAIRQSLREDMRRSPLLDHAAQAQRFEDALWACWNEASARPKT